jgi:hypothetical protein
LGAEITEHFKLLQASFEFQLSTQKLELLQKFEKIKTKSDLAVETVKQLTERVETQEAILTRLVKQKQTEQMVEIRKITAVTELLKTKYHGLLHHNDYLAKLCGLVSEAINANTVLMLQDEKDRQSMSLLGA